MLSIRNPDLYYGMGLVHRRKRVGRPRRLRRGAGFFSSIGKALSGAQF